MMKELQHAVTSSYAFHDPVPSSDAMVAAEAVQQKLERLLSYVQEYLDSRQS